MNKTTANNMEATPKATIVTTENKEIEVSPNKDETPVAKEVSTPVTNNVTKEINHNSKAPVRLINTMQEIEAFAEIIANTVGFKDPFEYNVEAEDGSVISLVKKEDIIANIILARELGLEPMQGIILGRTLNREAAIKIQYGKELGISTFASLREIYVWPSNGREVVYTGIGIIEGVLISLGIKKEIVQHPDNTPIIIDLKTKQPVIYDASKHVIVNGLPVASIDAIMKESQDKGNPKTLVKRIPRNPCDIIATVRLTRGETSLQFPYSLQDAIDAGLAPGVTTDGEEVKGKDNWAKYPKVMLIHKSTMTSARMIAADRLSGIYIADELSNLSHSANSSAIDVNYEEV